MQKEYLESIEEIVTLIIIIELHQKLPIHILKLR